MLRDRMLKAELFRFQSQMTSNLSTILLSTKMTDSFNKNKKSSTPAAVMALLHVYYFDDISILFTILIFNIIISQ